METWQTSATIAIWLALGIIFVVGMASFIIRLSRAIIRERSRLLQLEKERNAQHSYEMASLQVESVEKERTRIANDLHDSLIGKLNRFRWQLQTQSAHDIDEALKESIALTRQISHDLAPPLLDYRSLQEVMDEVINPWQEHFEIQRRGFESIGDLDSFKKLQLMRCLEEIMVNIHKHAEATIVVISVSSSIGFAKIQVIDNGIGFNEKTHFQGLGLRSIEARMTLIGGTASWKNTKTGGALVELEIPLE